eukprot:625789_1
MFSIFSRLMSTQHVAFWIVLALAKPSNCYFHARSLLNFDDATQFCSKICASELASIHNASQLVDAIDTITKRPLNQQSTAYIGLRSSDFPTVPFAWNDTTTFDFGYDTSLGTYPWEADHPQTHAPSCVLLDKQINVWKSVQCDETHTFLCNHCNGKLQKYALVNTGTQSHTDVNTLCHTLYGTTLASIHTERDNMEIQELLSISNIQNAWIGLMHGMDESDPTSYSWSDGTYFDYGRDVSCTSGVECDPWIATGPDNTGGNELCVMMDGITGKWDDTSCDELYSCICQLPSELTLNTWTANDGGWDWDATNMEFVHNGETTELEMLDTQWFNGDIPWRIDFTFSVDFKSSEWAYPGLFIFNGRSGSACEWYGIYLGREYSLYYVVIDGEKYYPQVANPRFIYDVYVTQSLKFSFANGQYYTMSIIITNGNTFDVLVNDVLHVSYTDDEPFSTLENGFSGYIGFYSYAAIEVKAKYLYISGTPKTVQDFDASRISNCVTPSPTLYSTKKPSVNPTKYHTLQPTQSQDPTGSLTYDPTETPNIIKTDTVPPTMDILSTVSQSVPSTATPSSLPVTSNPTERPTFGEAEVDMGSSTTESKYLKAMPIAKARTLWKVYLLPIVAVVCFVCLCVFCVLWFMSRRSIKSEDYKSEDVGNVMMMENDENKSVAYTSHIVNSKVTGERNVVKSWFEDEVGLAIYFEIFMKSEWNTMECIKQIESDSQLEEMGIHNTRHRKQIMSAIHRLCETKGDDASGGGEDEISGVERTANVFVTKGEEEYEAEHANLENRTVADTPMFISRDSFEVRSDSDSVVGTGGKL